MGQEAYPLPPNRRLPSCMMPGIGFHTKNPTIRQTQAPHWRIRIDRRAKALRGTQQRQRRLEGLHRSFGGHMHGEVRWGSEMRFEPSYRQPIDTVDAVTPCCVLHGERFELVWR